LGISIGIGSESLRLLSLVHDLFARMPRISGLTPCFSLPSNEAEARRKMALFQELISYTNAPASIRRGLRLPPTNPADLTSVPRFPALPLFLLFNGNPLGQFEFIGSQASRWNPRAGKLFPIPASSKHYNAGVGEEGFRDSKGRLFPWQVGRRSGPEDLNEDVGGDLRRVEIARASERGRGIVGGGSLCGESAEGALGQICYVFTSPFTRQMADAFFLASLPEQAPLNNSTS
jgi:hypothetical protein